MKIGITADVHLKTQVEHPERYNSLENILHQCHELNVRILIIAGDLFDQTMQNFSEFEFLCSQPKTKQITIHIIPGNHDLKIRQEYFSVPNVFVYHEPKWVGFGGGWNFLFIPYKTDKSMGEVIQNNYNQEHVKKWVLVGHGDWSGGVTPSNPYEPGFYMPITSKDIKLYKPNHVFLGHIHAPFDSGNLHYPGSPCGLNINETGHRRFLTFDLETSQIESHLVQNDIIYFIENITILPVEDESTFIRDSAQKSIQSWSLKEGDEEKVRLRVVCRGYSADKAKLMETIKETYNPYQLDGDPDLSQVSIASDPRRDYLMEKVNNTIESLDWASHGNEPTPTEIILEAMKLIYGEE
jgi:DNA repair exonuclease SbcCD nuclease subunit